MSVFCEEVDILQNHFGGNDGRMRENKENEDINFNNKFSYINEEAITSNQSSVRCDDYKYVVYLKFLDPENFSSLQAIDIHIQNWVNGVSV